MLQPADDLLKVLQLQGLGLFLLGRMQCTNPLEHLAHHRRLGRVGEPLTVVPLGQRRQPQLEGIDRQHAGMRHQIARHAVARRRQEPAPTDFEVLDGGAIAAASVVARRRLQVTIQLTHGSNSRMRTAFTGEKTVFR